MSEFLDLVEHDWAQTRRGLILHACRSFEGDDGLIPVGGPGVTECGIRSRLGIPGLFSRMGAMRCRRCCLVTGFPQGWGSPKNGGDELRALAVARHARWDGWSPTPEMAASYRAAEEGLERLVAGVAGEEGMTEYDAYVGTMKCGCRVAVMVDEPRFKRATAREVVEMIRLGYVVSYERISDEHPLSITACVHQARPEQARQAEMVDEVPA